MQKKQKASTNTTPIIYFSKEESSYSYSNTLTTIHDYQIININCHITLTDILKKRPKSIVIFQLSNAIKNDHAFIKYIRTNNLFVEFILLTTKNSFKELKILTKLNIFSIHCKNIHPSILHIDIKAIFKKSHQESIEEKINKILDKDILCQYKKQHSKAQKPQILIVEDHPTLQKKLYQYLNTNNIKCNQANTIKSALKLCEKNYFNIIILDIDLPDGTSDDYINHFQKTTPSSGIIMLTAYKDLELLTKCIRSGAHDYITKPFKPIELLESIYNTLDLISIKQKKT